MRMQVARCKNAKKDVRNLDVPRLAKDDVPLDARKIGGSEIKLHGTSSEVEDGDQ